MHVTFPCFFYEKYLPTPRHSILRERRVEFLGEAEVREVTLAEAPVAIRRTSPWSHRRAKGDRATPVDDNYGTQHFVDYHWFDGRLFAPMKRGGRWAGTGHRDLKRHPALADHREISYHQYTYHLCGSRDDAEMALRDAMAKFLLIDGILCEEIGEPRYVIMTFGLGGNHGIGWGTSVTVDHHFNSNIMTKAYWRIDQVAEMHAAGLATALGRGDTKAKPYFKRRWYDRFEILIPEAVRFDRTSRTDKVDPFMERVDAITSSGMPPVLGAFAVMAEAFRL